MVLVLYSRFKGQGSTDRSKLDHFAEFLSKACYLLSTSLWLSMQMGAEESNVLGSSSDGPGSGEILLPALCYRKEICM